jgi:glucokinase
MPERVLVADIGGTNARFATAELASLTLSDIRHVPCAGHPSLAHAMRNYLACLAEPPRDAAIAVAAPVLSDHVELTNSPWSFVKQDLCGEAGLDSLLVLNDFEALALSLPHLAPEELHQIGGTAPVENAPKLVFGPGTGLGVASLAWTGRDWVPLPGEGGHVTLGASDGRELAIIEHMGRGREHLSIERALSGPGLAALYGAIAAARGMGAGRHAPAEIVAKALAAEDEIAKETLDLFVAWLARYAADAALIVGARGGVYLGGGIPAKILPALTSGAFREAFEHKGRMRAFLAPIPVYVILSEFAALKGAAAAMHAALGNAHAVTFTLPAE